MTSTWKEILFQTDFQTDYPWKKIFTSATVCAYGFTRFSESWTTSFINQFIAVFVTGELILGLLPTSLFLEKLVKVF